MSEIEDRPTINDMIELAINFYEYGYSEGKKGNKKMSRNELQMNMLANLTKQTDHE